MDPARLSPQAVLYGADRPPLVMPPCVHYAGTERYLRKALALQRELGPRFDIAGDCEDGAPVGREREHAAMIAAMIASAENVHRRFGARVHDIGHPALEVELDTLVAIAGERLAFLTLPKAECAGDVERFIDQVQASVRRHDLRRAIPLSILIETPGAVHDAWSIAGLPGVASLDFGTLDYVSAHHGAIPQSAMESPGQFDHALLRRAKAEVAAAALAHGVVAAHGVTRALDDADVVYADARRARDEFGFQRMWSIHPAQIEPIVRAFTPQAGELEEAAAVLVAAQARDWAPMRVGDKLHDRASYRHLWNVVARAHAGGTTLPPAVRTFFANVSEARGGVPA